MFRPRGFPSSLQLSVLIVWPPGIFGFLNRLCDKEKGVLTQKTSYVADQEPLRLSLKLNRFAMCLLSLVLYA